MKEKITYKGKQFTIETEFPIRKHICECCGKKGLTYMHHWKYAYAIAEVRKQPALALHFVNEVCYSCHRPANSLRIITETKPEIINKLKQLEAQQNVN